MPSTFSVSFAAAAFVSPVATAKIVADLLSAIRRIPSGPNASCEMDLISGLPSVIPAVQFAACKETVRRQKTATSRKLWRVLDFISYSFGLDTELAASGR